MELYTAVIEEKGFKSSVVLDSIAPSGARLITMEVRYPRFIHSELMTHRAFSRNSASSRAIPTSKIIEQVVDNPAMPIYWGKLKRGMSPNKEVGEEEKKAAIAEWLAARDHAVEHAKFLYNKGIHKQITNRLLEPFMWMTVIITATDWSNWFALRDHTDAQQEIAFLAQLIRRSQNLSFPIKREWHLPYTLPEEIEQYGLETMKKVSTARCARVSYLTHDGKRSIEADLDLYTRLKTGSDVGHWSPFEHIARALHTMLRSGNFAGWEQYRKMHANECL